MKAAQYSKHGDSSVIEINEVPISQAKDGQLLVEVHAASINPFDYKVRLGYIPGMPKTFPVTIGGDFSGIIKETTGDFKEGDKVYGQAGFYNGGSGSMAEYVLAPLTTVYAMPKNLSFEEAASLPLAAVSALQALEEHIKLQTGQKILITGGAGGIGSFAIQIAKAIGAYVATTVSPDDVAFAKSLGADEVLDYRTQNVADILSDYDAVFNTAGEKTWDDVIRILKKGGVIVSMNGQPNPQLAQERGITSIGQGTQSSPEKLKRLNELVETGKITPHIDKVFPLLQTREAFVYQETQSPRGKVVVKIR